MPIFDIHHTCRFLQELFHKSNHWENIVKIPTCLLAVTNVYNNCCILSNIAVIYASTLNSKISCSGLLLRNQQTLPIKDKEPPWTFFHTSNSQCVGGDANGVTGLEFFLGTSHDHQEVGISLWSFSTEQIIQFGSGFLTLTGVRRVFFVVVQCSHCLCAHMLHMLILHFA